MKVLASDFDNTLYFNEHYHEEDLVAIKKLQAAGGKFGLCTGRPYLGLLDALDGSFKYDFLIMCSGAFIINEKNEPIFKKVLPYEVVKQVVTTLDADCSEGIMIGGLKKMYGNKTLKDRFLSYGANDFVSTMGDIDEIEDDEILTISLEFKTEEEAQAASKKIVWDCSAYVNKNSIDVVASGCSKGTGLKELQKYYGLVEDVACIGDHFNDLPMLEASSQSFTFNSSPSAVKEQATFLVDSVAECIEKLLGE